jgi:hypothetical protein
MAGRAPRTNRWWTLKEAADYFGCSRHTMAKYAKKSYRKYTAERTGMPVIRFFDRGPFRFPIEAFKAWVENPTK